MAYTKLIPRHTKDARVEEISPDSSHYLLSIPSGKADSYRLSQLDDYTKLRRKYFPLHSPLSLSLSARTSSNSIPGTWGFGLWNDPFGLSLGFGGNPFRLPALPNAVWFFGASEDSYLSFRTERSASHSKRKLQTNSQFDNSNSETNRALTTRLQDSGSAQRGAFNGFLAQTFRSPKFHPRLVLAGLAMPFARKWTRQSLGKIIDEDGTRLSVNVTQWHRYKIDWREEHVYFEVDDDPVFESPVSPHSPLGLVIWIDNQFAAFTPEGRIGLGVLENPAPAWLEVKDVDIM